MEKRKATHRRRSRFGGGVDSGLATSFSLRSFSPTTETQTEIEEDLILENNGETDSVGGGMSQPMMMRSAAPMMMSAAPASTPIDITNSSITLAGNETQEIQVGDRVCVSTVGGGKSKKATGMRPPRI